MPAPGALFFHGGTIGIWIDASVEQIRCRLVDCRRNSGPTLLRRLERVTQFAAAVDEDVRIDNNGTIKQAGEPLLAFLSRPARK